MIVTPTTENFDLIVIGSGPAGEKGAAQAAYHGKRVALVEQSRTLGGAVVSNAGIPTKTLRETALYLSGFRQREVYGLSLRVDRANMFEALRSRSAAVSGVMHEAVRANLERHDVELVHGRARLGPDRGVFVHRDDGPNRILHAEVVLIATGSRPARPVEVPFDDVDIVDSEGIVGFQEPFDTIVVVGGGSIACEFASVFKAVGVDTTLVHRGPRLLKTFDSEIAEALSRSFADVGMRIVLGKKPAVSRDEHGPLVELEGEVVRPDKVLFATGRRGNTDEMDLDVAGIGTDEQGHIVVDDHYETTRSGIYAAGDVIGSPALGSVSMEQARVAMRHAFGLQLRRHIDELFPAAVYSIPEVASVGLTEEQAASAGIDYETGRGRFETNARSVIAGHPEGLIKLVFERGSRKVLGVHIISDEASELIHHGHAVIHHGGTIDYFIEGTFNVPTRSDLYKYAAYDGLGRLERRVAFSQIAEASRIGG